MCFKETDKYQVKQKHEASNGQMWRTETDKYVSEKQMDKYGAQKQTNLSQRNEWTNMVHRNRQICLRERDKYQVLLKLKRRF